MRLEGHVAVVTGGTGALGRAVVSAFLAAGARVVATTRHAVDGESHERLSIEAVDLTDEQSMLALADTVRERYGRCDVLACCAGGFGRGRPWPRHRSRSGIGCSSSTRRAASWRAVRSCR